MSSLYLYVTGFITNPTLIPAATATVAQSSDLASIHSARHTPCFRWFHFGKNDYQSFLPRLPVIRSKTTRIEWFSFFAEQKERIQELSPQGVLRRLGFIVVARFLCVFFVFLYTGEGLARKKATEDLNSENPKQAFLCRLVNKKRGPFPALRPIF